MNGNFKTDITRDTFHRRKHYSRVLMQQGRVLLDADWNENQAIHQHYMRTLAADLIGPHAGPGEGFTIQPPPKVQAKAEDETEAEEEGEGKKKSSKKKKSVNKGMQQDTGAYEVLLTGGRYYVDGILCENDKEEGYIYTIAPDARQTLAKGAEADYLLYLDVWEREVTYHEDDSIREVALGGPDTATRAKVEWRVRARSTALIKDAPSATDQKYFTNDKLDPVKFGTAWTEMLQTWQQVNHGWLKARTMKTEEESYTNACTTPPTSEFRGSENQLYRVEIHDGGEAWPEAIGQQGGRRGGYSSYSSQDGSARARRSSTPAATKSYATFKVSRENGSVVFPITGSVGEGTISASTTISVTLEGLGRDDSRFALQEGDWVELVDLGNEVEASSGPLFQVDTVDYTMMEVTLIARGDITLDGDSGKCLLRRWDYKEGDPHQKGALQIVDDGAVMLIENKWLTLEDGIQIKFHRDEKPDNDADDQPPQYRTGDYWLIPARTASGHIEWPGHGHEHHALPPQGVEHHYAPLALATLDASGHIATYKEGNETKDKIINLRRKIKEVWM